MTGPGVAATVRPGGSPLRGNAAGAVPLAAGAVPLAAAAVVLAPVAASSSPRVLLAVLVGVLLVAVSYRHPPAAAYLLLAATPLTAGFARDAVVPVLRPHEALGLILATGVALRALAQLRATHRLPLSCGWLDVAFLLLTATSSLLPLLWMAARGLAPSQEDLLYAAAIGKFYGVFLLVRVSVRTEQQVARCLWICLAAGGVMAVVAVLQSTVGAAAELVHVVYPVEGGFGPAVGRGSATLGSSIAVGDVMAFNLAICLAGALLGSRHRRVLMALALVFALGGLGSGQFSGVIALGVAVLAVAVLTRQVGRLLLALVPATVVAALVLWPVLEARLADIDPATGLPQSWWVRLENLRLYVWPEVFTGWNWLFGVRPAAVVRVDAPWGNEIYIESGHTWLLWTGGVPFALAYLYFTWVAVRLTAALARRHSDDAAVAAVAAVASCAAVLVVFVLMTFDPHITMRGTADLLFSLLGLAVAGAGATQRAERARPAAVRA